MTRIAIFSDVHGNIPALEAVLTDITEQRVDEILVGGDLVGRGPQGSAVVKRIRALGLPTIGGNHEDYLLEFRRRRIPEDWRTTEEWAASRWMAAELDEEDAEYIAALPFSIERRDLKLVHGSPQSNREGIGPWTQPEDLELHLDTSGSKLLVCGHTHRSMVRELATGMIVNIGSVGLPFNKDRRAQYGIFSREDEHAAWKVELRQVDYDQKQIFRIYEETGFVEHGGITARLLLLELEHASPLLVPFLEWARVSKIEASLLALDDFFKFYTPGEPLRDFFERLQNLASLVG